MKEDFYTPEWVSQHLNATHGESLSLVIAYLKSDRERWLQKMKDIGESVDYRPDVAAQERHSYCLGRFEQCRATLEVMGVYS